QMFYFGSHSGEFGQSESRVGDIGGFILGNCQGQCSEKAQNKFLHFRKVYVYGLRYSKQAAVPIGSIRFRIQGN
ncbi:MAG: hypothetical protein K2L80_03025, partial [Muribaculaceae bacterium]|nr:hypothetical protein [Muribaculaceae bacterium]